jgi:hypothetical protein
MNISNKMTNNEFDITFVIPSHNGGKYLESTVLKILGQNENRFKLVVSFNDLRIPDWASKIDDNRIEIIQTPEKLSMARHYESILPKIKTPWVSFLGDDDSILENGISLIQNKISEYPDAKIHMFRRSYFYWPTENKKPIISKILLIKNSRTKKIYKIRLLAIILGFLEHFEIPQLYTGSVISIDLIKAWQELHKNLNLYREPNPDVYSSVILNYLNKHKTMHHSESAFWVGTSDKSFGKIKSEYNKVKSNYEAQNFLSLNEKNRIKLPSEFSDRIWRSGTSSVNVVSSLLKAPIERSKISREILRDLALSNLVAKCLLPFEKIEERNININLVHHVLTFRINQDIDKKSYLINITMFFLLTLFSFQIEIISQVRKILIRLGIILGSALKNRTLLFWISDSSVTNYQDLTVFEKFMKDVKYRCFIQIKLNQRTIKYIRKYK